MTPQEKLHVVETAIRKALPRLMELSQGCKLEKDGYFYTYIGKLIPEIDFRYTNPYYLHHFYSEEFIKDKKETFLYTIGDKKFKHYKIIGHDILLSDVLEWLAGEHNNIEILLMNNGIILINFREDKPNRIVIDLSKPLLADQSEELWNFLYNLLEDNE